MKLAELQQLSTKELKELATKENVNATGDKRARITWLIALYEHFKESPSPSPPSPEPEPEEAEEPFVPKFHQIYVTEAGIIRYRYRHESYKSEWIRWCDSLDELCNSLREIEASLEGTCTYKNYKIQVTPLLEINYKPPSGDWLKLPIEPDEDIQEALTRLHDAIDRLSRDGELTEKVNDLWCRAQNAIDNSFPSFIDKLPDDYAPFSTIFKQVIYATIPQGDLVEFRRNCQAIAASPRPP